MLKQYVKVLSGFVLMGCLAQSVSANLLINPTRVEFGPNDRSTDITLINTSQTINTYRIEWVEKKAQSGGGYHNLHAAEAAKFPVASSLIRYSPRQVTLRPGERQTVKMALRRPQGLAAGEYRSHLQFKALPPVQEGDATNAATTSINVILNFAIPVVVQQGQLDYAIDVNSAQIAYNTGKREGAVTVAMNRSGHSSVIGNLNAYWTPNGGQERLIGKLGDYNFWPELSSTTATLAWVGAEFAVTDGKLRIQYEGSKTFRGKVFFDKTFLISRGAIKTL